MSAVNEFFYLFIIRKNKQTLAASKPKEAKCIKFLELFLHKDKNILTIQMKPVKNTKKHNKNLARSKRRSGVIRAARTSPVLNRTATVTILCFSH